MEGFSIISGGYTAVRRQASCLIGGMSRRCLFTAWSLFVTLPILGLSAHGATMLSVPFGSPPEMPEMNHAQSLSASPSHLYDFSPSERVELEALLKDPEGRVDPMFNVPDPLRHSVQFWFRVYVEWSAHQLVFFDERHPEVIYEVLDFTDIARTSRNAVVYEILRKRRIDAKLSAYRSAFARLQKSARPRRPTREENNILAAWSKHTHRHSFHDRLKNLRTQTGQRDQVIRGLLSAAPYYARMKSIFQNHGIPADTVYLSILESSFNLEAVSRVGATGVWQFMLATGKEFMVIDDSISVDERLSPLKSTVAAARLLKRHHRMIENWPLTITSYNYGLRHILSVPETRRSGTRALQMMAPCSKSPHRLGWAGRNYYPGLIALIHAAAYKDIVYPHLLFDSESVEGIRFVALERPVSLSEYAYQAGFSLKTLAELNPDIRDQRVSLPRGFWIAVPGRGTTDDLAGLMSPSRSRWIASAQSRRR